MILHGTFNYDTVHGMMSDEGATLGIILFIGLFAAISIYYLVIKKD